MSHGAELDFGRDGPLAAPTETPPGNSRNQRLYMPVSGQKGNAMILDRIENDAEFRTAAEELRGKILGCHCKPKPCHGDVIAAWCNGELDVATAVQRAGARDD